MVDDVEQIELVRPLSHPPWVIDETVEEAIRIVSDIAPADYRYAREPPMHRRPKLCDLECGRMVRGQLTVEHVSHQVHARPVFLQQVADQSDLRLFCESPPQVQVSFWLNGSCMTHDALT